LFDRESHKGLLVVADVVEDHPELTADVVDDSPLGCTSGEQRLALAAQIIRVAVQFAQVGRVRLEVRARGALVADRTRLSSGPDVGGLCALAPGVPTVVLPSARNRFVGLVTEVISDTVTGEELANRSR
jgi:hypothetical protein